MLPLIVPNSFVDPRHYLLKRSDEPLSAPLAGDLRGGSGINLRIPDEAARDSGMMSPTHSEMMSPTIPR